MSYTVGDPTEILYSYANPSTNLATFTTEDNLQKTYPPVKLNLPALYANPNAVSRNIRVRARGQLGTTGAPTFSWSLRLLTTTTWSAGGILLGTTGAITAGTTQTLAPWKLEADITLRTLSIAAASTVVAMGEVTSPLGLASPFAATIPANNTAATSATVDDSLLYFLFLSCACGSSSGSNLINTQQLLVYGE